MSTRSQLRFIEYGNITANIYRHSDGYPEGFIPDFLEFLHWYTGNPAPRSLNDLSYASANWIYWSKMQLQHYDSGGMQYSKLGYGILPDNAIQPDVEYLYQFDGEVLMVSEHLWGGDISGWESVPWAFTGDLLQVRRQFAAEIIPLKVGGDLRVGVRGGKN